MARLPSLLLGCLVSLSTAAHAQVNRCTGPDGKVTYQSEPCPTTAKSGTVRPPTPPSSPGGSASGKGQDGWDPARLERAHSGCVQGGMRDGRAGWNREAAQNPSLGPFPEAGMRASTEALCTCLVNTLRSNMRPDESETKLAAFILQITGEALGGGRCKPGGTLGRMLGH